VGGTAELRSWILSFGAGAEVLEPAPLRAEVVKELAGAADRYRPGAALRAPSPAGRNEPQANEVADSKRSAQRAAGERSKRTSRRSPLRG
jgi:hypothetical protein